jgi:hypothetical protein
LTRVFQRCWVSDFGDARLWSDADMLAASKVATSSATVAEQTPPEHVDEC